jgi:hypothetical protein
VAGRVNENAALDRRCMSSSSSTRMYEHSFTLKVIHVPIPARALVLHDPAAWTVAVKAQSLAGAYTRELLSST